MVGLKINHSLAFVQLRLIIMIDNINVGTHLFEIGKVDLEKFFVKRRGLWHTEKTLLR